jgi:hypothetical protein
VFGVVTFETDFYREQSTRDESRELFKQKGYVFIKELNSQDDYYIHSTYIK